MLVDEFDPMVLQGYKMFTMVLISSLSKADTSTNFYYPKKAKLPNMSNTLINGFDL